MDDPQARRKGRRRSLRNLRRSSTNFTTAANVSCLEHSVLEDRGAGDLSVIIHNYGSAWVGDENTDPMLVVNKTVPIGQNAALSFDKGACFNPPVTHDSKSAMLISPTDVHAHTDKNVSETPGELCLLDRSFGDLVEQFRCTNDTKEVDGVRGSPLSSMRQGSNSSLSDSLPELDLSLYGSVEDCLRTQSQGSFDSPVDSLTFRNEYWKHVKNHKNGNSPIEERDSLNDAFMDGDHDLLQLSRESKPPDSSNHEQCNAPLAPETEGTLYSQPTLGDIEMQPLCEPENNINESCSIPNPKVRKVSSEEETLTGSSADDSGTSSSAEMSGSSSSINKTSSVLGMTMISAIQSLASRLEALSAISDSEGGCNAKSSTLAVKQTPSRRRPKTATSISKSDSKAGKHVCNFETTNTGPPLSQKLSKSHLDVSCPGDPSGPGNRCQNDDVLSELKRQVPKSKASKSRKRLSLNKQSSSATDIVNENNVSKSSPPSIESSVEKSKISKQVDLANDESEEKPIQFQPPSDNDNGASRLDVGSLGENAQVTTCIENDNTSDTVQNTASNSNLGTEEALLLAELSLRFPSDSTSSKEHKSKSRRSVGSSRRRSSRWLSLPSYDSNSPSKIIQLHCPNENFFEGPHADLDSAYQASLSPRKSFGSAADLTLDNDADKDCRITGTDDEPKELATSSDTPFECLNYEENLNNVAQSNFDSNVSLRKSKPKKNRKKSRKSLSSTCDQLPQTGNLDHMAGTKARLQVSEGNSIVDLSEVDLTEDQVMGDHPATTSDFIADNRLSDAAPEAMDISNHVIKNQVESNFSQDSDPCEPLAMHDEDTHLASRRKSTRNQRTCKRKSWVLPTANESSSSTKEKQKRGGRKVSSSKKTTTACSSPTNQNDTLQNPDSPDEFEVNFSCLYLAFNC